MAATPILHAMTLKSTRVSGVARLLPVMVSAFLLFVLPPFAGRRHAALWRIRSVSATGHARANRGLCFWGSWSTIRAVSTRGAMVEHRPVS